MLRFVCRFKLASIINQESFAQLRNIQIKSFSQSPNGLLNSNCQIIQESRRYAGHSKWKNIKHTKEARDSMRQKLICAHVRKIGVAIQAGGGQTNPKLNPFLAKIIENGKAMDIPVATMNRAIDNIIARKSRQGALTQVEARTVNGVSFIIETTTDRVKFYKSQVAFILKKHGGKIMDGNVCAHNFSRKGVIYVPAVPMSEQDNPDYVKLDPDRALEIAVDAGAENVVEDVVDDEPMFKFYTDMQDLGKVKRYIEDLNLKPTEARLEFIPNFDVTMPMQDFELVENLRFDIQELEETETIYYNAKPNPEETK